MKTALYCGSCGALYADKTRRGTQPRRCVRCGNREELAANCLGVSLIIRKRNDRPEVLLICRDHSHPFGAGLWCLPGGPIRWNEDLQATVRRETREKTGLKIDVGATYETISGFMANQLAIVSSFFAIPKDPEKEPRAGPRVERVAYFPLDEIPELAYETDQTILSLLQQTSTEELKPSLADHQKSQILELRNELRRHERRYEELMDLYMQELMRGAWINDLLVNVANTNEDTEITQLAVQHLTTHSDLGLARLWLPGPADQCESCPWAKSCPQKGCLHLLASSGDDRFSPEDHDMRLPPVTGTPAGDTCVRDDLTQYEVSLKSSNSCRFEGFPLDVGLDFPGVLGFFSQEQREPGERRIFQFVARAISGTIKNARLHQELKRSDQVKRIFIDKMSHSLKTPLTVILGYAELLKEDREAAKDEYGYEGAAAIEKSGRDLYTLVESILFITKLESGRLPPKSQRVDPHKIINKIIEQERSKIENKALEIQFTGESEFVWADAQWLERIMEELLSNAIKFTADGKISILIGREKDDVLIAVHDTGIGMEKTNRSRIFEPFTQGTKVEDDYQVNLHYGGLGVGLAIARTLVEQSGGHLWVESSPGEGSRFTFTLPRTAK